MLFSSRRRPRPAPRGRPQRAVTSPFDWIRLIEALHGVELRPHDLLWLKEGTVPHAEGPLPAWATPSWRARAPVVVRRATPAGPGHVPVGLRGRARHERWAAVVDPRDVLRMLSPDAVLQGWLRRAAPPVADRPCLRTLDVLARALRGLPLVWGVTGGVGFALATGIDVLREDSDLDLLVRAPARADGAYLRDIAPLLHDRPSRVDVQVETPLGAFALIEWLRTGGSVLLKTDRGPALREDPWA